MLATRAHSLSFHSSPPTAAPYILPSSRTALADSTNVGPRSDVCSLGPKGVVYPTSFARIGCDWNDVDSPTGSISFPLHSRHHHLSAPSPFLVTYKAPPTVSISLSAACSQNIRGERCRGSGVQSLEPDLPDVRSVVPFPSTPLDADVDVEMLDETCVPCPTGSTPCAGQAHRKRRSAYSSASLQGGLGKDTKQKRPRKSKRQVVELWWLGVVHRSILRGVEARQSVGELRTSDRLPSRPCDFDAMDRVLAERIQKRLTENGCVDGRLPSSLSRISSPSLSVPSVNLLAPSRKTLPMDSAPLTLSVLNPKEHNTSDGTTTALPASKAPPRASLSIISYSPISSSSSSLRRHVRFEIAPRPRRPQSHASVPRRSPSPPARVGTVPTHVQNLTLTMPQLVASLTLAHHERSGLRLRGRTCRPTGCEKDAGCSPPSVSSQVVKGDTGDATQNKERMHLTLGLRTRLSNAPERKSPLSLVTYAES